MKYGVKAKYEQFTSNVVLQPADYGGWQLLNIGDTPVIVNGNLLSPTGAAAGIDFTNLPPNVIWEESINIRFVEPMGNNPRVVVTRLKYTEIKES